MAKDPKPPKDAKQVSLILREVLDGAELADAVAALEAEINALMADDKKWNLGDVDLVQYNDGKGGRNYLLASMTLDA